MSKKRVVPEMRGVKAFLSSLPEITSASGEAAAINSIAIENILLPSKQPRRYFDSEKLEDLAASIRQHGVLEPILVRPLPDGKYELVAGERRYKASQLAGLKEIPIVVRELSDQGAVQLALVENLQREDLNPVEETEGLLELLTLNLQCSREKILDALTQMATAQKKGTDLSVNVSRRIESIAKILKSTVGITPESFRTSRLPLLKLPPDVLEVLRRGKLEYTKARAISRLKDDSLRQKLLQEAIAQNLSLTQIKERFQDLTSTAEKKPTLSDRLVSVSRKVKQGLDDPKKQRRLEKLLQELESLVEEY
ncbi:ParB/RepB/Spo0J family partition protein [Leptolyngbya sp. FACHB-711]|uniref:ParB/RepB/Spo0J family partition protein n=1 Tax=unclassified Leptolyngbya TaxID=2650499 RepID=UPI001687FF6D|nr:ParB/RepB/Spo0J family partition protein [Leptolyngbya sp. FACHB-711]MBD1853978.1 ParB/RepB/Spo0J family partition protein [Cyanobacteria bacterium FACHB-502]MBD2024559.1 ParB/RepB/Spo0J family partition protein [Leptolyngbya sp. FACHB-711]